MGLLALAVTAAGPLAAGAADRPIVLGSQGPLDWFETPAAPPDLTLQDAKGGERKLADFKGKVVLLNLWATWCAPCVKEMPALDKLQTDLGGADFEVVALSLDRGGARQVEPFFKQTGITSLTMWLDPKGAAMSAFKVRGLPTTLLIGRDGKLLAKLEGDADWAGPQAKAVIREALGPKG